MKLPITVLNLDLHIHSFTGVNTYTIKGKKGDGREAMIQLSDAEWTALSEERGHAPTVGDVVSVELPGCLPEEEDD